MIIKLSEKAYYTYMFPPGGFYKGDDVTRFCLLYFRGLGKQGYQCQGEKDTSHVFQQLLIVFYQVWAIHFINMQLKSYKFF
jgi:hypothetical protein